METSNHVQLATTEDARYVIDRLRYADYREVHAATGQRPDLAIWDGFRRSTVCWTASHEGVPCVLFGVAPVLGASGVGSPWLIATPEVNRMTAFFAKNSREYVLEMGKNYGWLLNYVDDRNTLSKRWLKWCGFTIDPPVEYGPFKMMFRRFWRVG